MPKQLRSPTWVQKLRKGNCFECATFLTSLLLGQGYNAFVVSGYASREQTLCDLTRRSCPYILQPEKHTKRKPEEQQPKITKYELKLPIDYKSQFLSELEEEKARKLEEKLIFDEKEQQKLIEELEQLPPDEHRGHRIHAWVAILPELGGVRDQEIPYPLFIESTTGVSFEATDDDTAQLYLGVESIWNDKNYWVNMQSSVKSCVNIVWDLMKVELWEHLLPGEPWTMHGVGEEIDEESDVQPEKHLDMPFSYVDPIKISEAEFEKRFPNGTKTILYKKTKVELFAPYLQLDGVVQRITIYNDYDYTTPIEIYETYANRSDNLVESRRNINDNTVIDYYRRGRADQCKEHRYFVDASNEIDSERILDFYHVPRFDGLSKFEMNPSYLTQHFVGRDDFLYYRHVQFSQDRKTSAPQDIHYRHILNIVEKFNRDERIKASRNIAIREFAISENEIRLTYHYHSGQFTRAIRTYIKPPLAERGERLILDPSMMHGYTPLDESEKSLNLLYELETQLYEEDVSISQVRAAEKELCAFLETRDKEYLMPTLLISVYDKLRESKSLIETLVRTKSEKDITEDVNYLKPYLARLGNPPELSKIDAQFIQYTCLNDYKQLLMRRANKILREFDECSQELMKTQALITQEGDLTREEEEEILEKINELNFYLQTLETRLDRHRDLVPIRYKMLLHHLQQNPHLTVLKGDN
ncbi:dynein regulatory complex subunit 7-like isoform X1 [Bombus vosnesenskii]|uniref:Dynein regulatory complex subunit 7-like isoform X1 n=1 Tax=Bombus vosnesenskii TaxID=207650 RepID=A0A6J3K639_9HYME|nr:dynein regulatory complex subunit 7-like isoform X1 [Bombus vancouverensis nearcticus]XP_033189226.1 dynein regulatory complex subunit 7-like isoform X2 [Bombus vancouverensis nearcticus]XP_033347951.1 dynein regulatory complex subunit 7-like isoform X1 [Bombus vosnesenskii]XP_050487060.1 dynein regulatory complex subunit 7-like isoform X2 [Bombus huntii]